jgi:TPR repeat protein
LNGELGLKDRQKDGFKWLKQVAALAESNNENSSNNGGSVQMNGGNSQDGLNGFSSSPSGVFGLDDPSDINGSGNNNNQGTRLCTVQALHELALLHERGIHNVVFVDNEYAAELLARASELGYAPSAYKLGECYEYGRMGCPQDAALSIHYYSKDTSIDRFFASG